MSTAVLHDPLTEAARTIQTAAGISTPSAVVGRFSPLPYRSPFHTVVPGPEYWIYARGNSALQFPHEAQFSWS